MKHSATLRRVQSRACVLAAGLATLAMRPAAALELGGVTVDLDEPAALVFAGLALALLVALVVSVASLLSRGRLSLYRDLFQAVPHPRQVVDAEGRVHSTNAACLAFFKGTAAPVPDLLIAATDDAEAREVIAHLAAQARQGFAGEAEIPLRRWLDAESRPEWCGVAAKPVLGRPGWVFWMVEDLALRGPVEQAARIERDGLIKLLGRAPIGYYSVDGTGRFLFVNETLAAWLGQSAERMVQDGVRLHDVIAQVLPPGTVSYNPFDDSEQLHGDVLLKAADGRILRADITQEIIKDAGGRVLQTRSLVRDVTEERATADALVQSERRFDRFFQQAPLGIALIASDGQIVECNKAIRVLAAFENAPPAGTTLFDLVVESNRAQVRAGLDQVAAGAGGILPIEVRLTGKGDISCALFITRAERSSGPEGGFIAYFIDLTEQKSLEAQFAQSQKMQAVGQLAGGIAHDFNNLLTAMIGFSDLLLLRHRPGDQSFADIMQIKQNANRAANLVRQLLAFSRQQTMRPRVLDVTDILAELSHLLRRLIGESIELKMIHGRDLGAIKADQGQLEQVIINLAVNARDAMAGEGQVIIKTENMPLDREVRRKGEVMPPGDYIRIEVTDTGHGIGPEHIDRIFEPFFSTKEVGAGTGLGLSTVYGIVKQSGGFVFADSRVGEGTTFSIYLPHYIPTEGEETPGEAAAEESRDLTGIGTVLLVEDEDGVRAFSARALRNKGYEVLEARSGDDALDLLDKRQQPIDLLITDVVMPRLDGPALVRQVRESRPDLKVIFISGYTEDAFRKRLDQEAGIHFLPKPFSLKQLAGKVKEVMREGTTRNVATGSD